MTTDVSKGTYRHTKSGKTYEVIGTALQTETHEMLVIYRPMYKVEYELFARPLDMFVENIIVGGEYKARFERLEDGI